MQLRRVLVVGGYGFFGRRLVERLSNEPEIQLIVAGRDASAGARLAEALRPTARATLQADALDAQAPDLSRQIDRLGAHIVVHASGPFQGQDYQVARACIASGAHYIDLADGRAFVAGIGALDDAARAAGVAVISGASSVPALSSAVVDHLANGLQRLHAIDIGISPGNRTDRGVATVRAILSYCGQPLPQSGAGPSFGWSGTRRHTYPAPVGPRLLSPAMCPT